MKKALPVILAVIAVVAVIFGIVSNVNGNQAKSALEQQIATLQSDAEKAASDSAAALEAAVKAAQDEAATAAESAKAEADEALAAAVKAAQDEAATAAETAKAEADAALEAAVKAAQDEAAKAAAEAKTAADAALETAVKAAQDEAAKAAETAKAEADAALDAAVKAAKEEAEKSAAAAAEKAQTTIDGLNAKVEELTAAAGTAAEAAAKELEAAQAQVTELTAKVEELEAAISADNSKEELAAALARVDELEAKVEELNAQLAKAERAVIAAQGNAYIMYANADWSVANWGTADSEDGNVLVTPANVNGAGDYTVGLTFATPAEGLAFAAVGINNGEKLYPNYYITINAIRVNGQAIEFGKGYTSSDDGIVTRVNLYNEWVSELPSDARRLDGDLADAAAIIVDKELFASVSSIEVDFSFGPAKAYLMYADGSWTNQNWGYASTDAVTVNTADIVGEGDYSVSLEFAQPADGLAFAALGIKNGEKDFPNWLFDVTAVRVNGEAIEIGKGYTSSDDGLETRSNIYNEWVTALPEDARSSGDLAECSPKIVDPALFTGVTLVEVDFHVTKREPAAIAAAAEAPMTKEEADALKAEGFKAYIGVQGKDTYIFRNAWNDTYGLNDEEHPYFNRLTGWDDETTADGSSDYAGTFVDTDITGDGEYTVSLTTGEKGFGTTTAFNLLFVSTNIPSKLYKDGFLTISDVKTAIGSAAAKEYTEIDTEGDYVLIRVLDSYNQSAEPFGYTVPGAGESITITFTVSNW